MKVATQTFPLVSIYASKESGAFMSYTTLLLQAYRVILEEQCFGDTPVSLVSFYITPSF